MIRTWAPCRRSMPVFPHPHMHRDDRRDYASQHFIFLLFKLIVWAEIRKTALQIHLIFLNFLAKKYLNDKKSMFKPAQNETKFTHETFWQEYLILWYESDNFRLLTVPVGTLREWKKFCKLTTLELRMWDNEIKLKCCEIRM